MDEQNGQPGHREVSPLLGLGIFLMPYLFAWATLRPGYSPAARVASLAWVVVVLAIVAGKPNHDGPAPAAATPVTPATADAAPAADPGPAATDPGPTHAGSHGNLALRDDLSSLAAGRLELVATDPRTGQGVYRLSIKNGWLVVARAGHPDNPVQDQLTEYDSPVDNCVGFEQDRGPVLGGVVQYLLCRATEATAFRGHGYTSNALFTFSVAAGDLYYKEVPDGTSEVGSPDPMYLRVRLPN